MTNSNGNFDQSDVLPEPLGRFTGTVTPLSVMVDHFTETVEHGVAELKGASREPSVNLSQLIALAQSQPAATRQQTVARLLARVRSQTAALPKFCSFLFGAQQAHNLPALLRLRERTNAVCPSVVSRASQK